MRGKIEKCWLFTFRAPEAEVRKVVPAPLEPVCRDGFGFWNVVACELSGMRPWPLPGVVGMRYRHVAYRIPVTAPGFIFQEDSESTPEGLYFVRSDCDNGLIGWAGNRMTDFRFHNAQISLPNLGEQGMVRVGGAVEAEAEVEPAMRAEISWRSPFDSVADAAEFLKYKPAALCPDGSGGVRTVRIRRKESDWRAKITGVRFSHWGFFDGMDGVEPEVCYALDPIEYEWARWETLVRRGR